MVEIPLKPKKPSTDDAPKLEQPEQPSTDGASKPEQPEQPSTDDATVTGKRKREGSSDVEPSSHDAKRLASASVPDSKGIEAIILDDDANDDEGGAIMIDD